MMHRNDFVVSVCMVGGKAFREYGIDGQPDTFDTRIRQINIPFNQEYEFKFKNMKNVRRSVSIDIDGTNIGTWVIPHGSRNIPSEVSLERFLESDKRFKVLALNDGGVDNPDNPDNGIIKIKVVDEKQTYSVLRGCGPSIARGSMASYSCDSYNLSTAGLGPSNAATGEGSKSNQGFTTTSWSGDSGIPFYFVFKINGINKSVVRSGFCTECGSELISGSKFCHKCGNRVAVTA